MKGKNTKPNAAAIEASAFCKKDFSLEEKSDAEVFAANATPLLAKILETLHAGRINAGMLNNHPTNLQRVFEDAGYLFISANKKMEK
jgi:hypothetical protein